MNPKDTLKPYIEAHIEKNIPVEAIRNGLVSHGWDSSIVDEVIAEIEGKPSPALSEELQAIARSYTKENYNAIDAVKDVVSAFSFNPGVICSFLLLAATLTAFAEFGTARVNTMFRESFDNTQDVTNLLLIVVGQSVVILLLLVAVWGLTVTPLWIVINDSKENKKKQFTEIVRSATIRSIRVIVSSILYGLVTLSPLIVAVLLVQATVNWLPYGLVGGFSLIILSSFVALYLLFKFIFVPIIALFEGEVRYKSLFARARHLMSVGGMLFALQIAIPVVAASIAVNLIEPNVSTPEESLTPSVLAKSILFWVISLFISCMWVMYYRNRKIVRA